MASSDDQTIDQFDRVLNVELGNRLVGVVRVDLSCLDFVKGREIDPHTVQGLTNLFESTACRRNDPKNYIDVHITPTALTKALKASSLTEKDLGPQQDGALPFLTTAPNQRLLCQYGRHRIKAAEQFLPSNDQWWTVILYVKKSTSTSHVPQILKILIPP
jgi:hypothetical protein